MGPCQVHQSDAFDRRLKWDDVLQYLLIEVTLRWRLELFFDDQFLDNSLESSLKNAFYQLAVNEKQV